MNKIYVYRAISGLRQLSLLEDVRPGDSRLFQHIPHELFVKAITLVEDFDEADYFLLPHYYTDVSSKPEYIQEATDLAGKHNKIICIITSQDDPRPISLAHAIVLRPSAYRSLLQRNEFIIPGQVEDLGAQYGVQVIHKGTRPVIGFVGKAGFDRFQDRIRYYLRNYLQYRGPRREGMYFRRKSLALLHNDKRIELRTIVRKRFSGNTKSIEVSPLEARSAYVQNMKDSLFTLAPRGDGNYSLRFYETLSLGRIPVLIDTDMKLPFEEKIAYDDFIVRIPEQALGELPERLWNFWNSHSEEDLIEMQKKARRAFEEYLYMPIFFQKFFSSDIKDTL